MPSSKYCLRTLTNGRLAYLHRLCDLLIDPGRTLGALVGLEQDASVGELAGRGRAGGDQAFEVVSFGISKDNGILFLHNGRSIPTVPLSNHFRCHTVLAMLLSFQTVLGSSDTSERLGKRSPLRRGLPI